MFFIVVCWIDWVDHLLVLGKVMGSNPTWDTFCNMVVTNMQQYLLENCRDFVATYARFLPRVCCNVHCHTVCREFAAT
jgi:hypothetical protein